MRVKSINTYLPFLKDVGKGETLSERDLVKNIAKNLPRAWQAQFRIAGGQRLKTVLEMQHLLQLIEQQEGDSSKEK